MSETIEHEEDCQFIGVVPATACTACGSGSPALERQQVTEAARVLGETQATKQARPRTSFGWEIGPSQFGPRGIVGKPELSGAGNLIIRAGIENEMGWHQVAHVVLTPDEADAFLTACRDLLADS
jgi:hypothetical protein